MSYRDEERQHNKEVADIIGKLVMRGILMFLCLIALSMWGCPQYKVWEQRLEGQAELARAEQNRQIRVQEAKAKEESAELEAHAEVKRAKGLSEANKILGQSLSGEQGERYLRYLWITGIEKGDNREVIYIPTEANLPILEANRLPVQQRK